MMHHSSFPFPPIIIYVENDIFQVITLPEEKKTNKQQGNPMGTYEKEWKKEEEAEEGEEEEEAEEEESQKRLKTKNSNSHTDEQKMLTMYCFLWHELSDFAFHSLRS